LHRVYNNKASCSTILNKISENSPKLCSISNVDITDGALDCFESLMTISNLTTLHFVYFKLSAHTFSCLLELPKLTSLAIKNLFVDEQLDLIEFGNNSVSRNLKLHHLDIREFDQFTSLCDVRCLKSLYLTFGSPRYSDSDLDTISFGLQRGANVQTLKLNVLLDSVERLKRLLTSVDLMNSLTSFTFEGGSTQKQDWEQFPAKFYNNVTKLHAYFPLHSDHRENLSHFQQFPNLRHLVYYCPAVESDVVFEQLPNLRSLVNRNSTREGAVCRHWDYAMGFSVLSKVVRK